MNPTFEKYYRQLGHTTIGLLVAAAVVYGITRLCIHFGYLHAGESLEGVAFSLGYAFAVLVTVFLLASLAEGMRQWATRR